VEFIAGVRSGAAASSEKRSSVRDLLDIARQGAAAAAARRKEAAQKQQAQSEEAEAGSQSDASSASSFGDGSDSSASREQSTSNLTATATRPKEEATGVAENTSASAATADATDAAGPAEESFVEDKDVSASEWRRSRRKSHGATLSKLRSLRASATKTDAAAAADATVRRSRTSSRRTASTGGEGIAESAPASHVDSRRASNKSKAARASAGANTVNAMVSAEQQQIATKRASVGSKVKASLHTRKSSGGVGSTGSQDERPRDDDDDDDVEQEEEETGWNSDEGEGEGEGDEAAGDANDESVELAPLVFSDEEDEHKSPSSSPRGAGTDAASSATPQKGILRSSSSSIGRQSSKQLLSGHRSSSGALAHGTPPSSRGRSRRTSGAPRSVQFASPNARAATLPPRPTRVSDPTIASLDVSAWSTSSKSSPPRAFRRHLSGQQQQTLMPEVPARFAAARTATSPRMELGPSKGSLKQRQQQSLSRMEAYALALRNQQQMLHEQQQQRLGARSAATKQSIASAMRSLSPGSTAAAVVVVSSRPTSSSSVRSRSGSPGRGSASGTPRAHSPLPPLSNVATESSAAAYETAPRPLQGVRSSGRSRRNGGKGGGGVVRRPAMEGMQSPSALILFDEKFFVNAHAQAVQEAARLAAAADAAAAAAAAHAQALQAATVRDHVSTTTTPFPPSSAAPSRPRSRVASRRASRSVSRSALHDSVDELEEEAWEEEAVSGRSRSRLDWSPSRGDSPSRRAAASIPAFSVAGRSTQPLDDESFAVPTTASSSPMVALPTHVSERSYVLVRRGGAGSTVPMPRARTVRSPASFALPLPLPRAQAGSHPAPPGSQSARIGMMALASAREAALAAAAAGSQTARAASSALAALQQQQQRPHTSWQPSRPSQKAAAPLAGWFGATSAVASSATSTASTAVPFPPVSVRPRTSGSLIPAASSSLGATFSAHRSRRRSQMRASFDAVLRVPDFIKVAAYKRREEL
jgi:hypothetical protein